MVTLLGVHIYCTAYIFKKIQLVFFFYYIVALTVFELWSSYQGENTGQMKSHILNFDWIKSKI